MRKLFVATVAILLLIGCTNTIDFTTIEKSASGRYTAEEGKTLVFVIWEQSETANLKDRISENALLAIEKVDFEENYVIAVYQEDQGCLHEGVTTDSIQLEDDTLTIKAKAGPFTELCLTAMSYPYHVVSLPKSEKPSEVNLYFNDELVLSRKIE